MDVGWMAAIVAVIGLGGNALLTVRSSGKTQGALESGLKSLSEKLEDHADQNRLDFEAIGKRVDGLASDVDGKFAQHASSDRREFDAVGRRIDNCEMENGRQWSKINDHADAIGILKGRLNGKAAGA